MTYSRDLKSSAKRTIKSAQILYDSAENGDKSSCKAVAGYLFGLAGELAVKEIMRQSDPSLAKNTVKKDDPFYAHFPSLKARLKENIKGRHAGKLRKIADEAQLFQYWDIKMRYAPTKDIQLEWVTAWKLSAERLIIEMGTL